MAILTANGITFAVGNELNSRRQIFDIGTNWVFYQASAPTFWTKSDTNNNKALRVVAGSGGITAGTQVFTTVMSNFNVGGGFSFPTSSTGGHPISLTETPIHAHGNGGSINLNAVPALFNPDGAFVGWNGGDVNRAGGWTRIGANSGDTTSPTGVRGANHSHPFSASATLSNQPINIAVQYIDVISCTFNG
jgi:hypothetical protein